VKWEQVSGKGKDAALHKRLFDEFNQAKTLSGKEFSKGLLKATIQDIKGETLGIVADPLRHTTDFISKNALKLTDDEIEKLTSFTRKVLRTEGATADDQMRMINDWIGKNLKVPVGKPIATPTTPIETLAGKRPPKKTAVPETPLESLTGKRPQKVSEEFKKEFFGSPREKIARTKKQVETPKSSFTKEQEVVVDKITQALKEVKTLRGKQERIYTKERGERLAKFLKKGETVSGEVGFKKQLSQLKGEFTKVQFESLREKITQADIDELFNIIKITDRLPEWQKISAGNGLLRILGEKGGRVPTNRQIELLTEVFGKEMVGELKNMTPLFQQFKKAGLEIANIPRSLLASFDLSAPFRQGIFTFARHPVIFTRNLKDMVKAFGSEKYYQALLNEIHTRPTYKAMMENKVAITELGSLSSREEQFMSNWAELLNIPLGKKGALFSKEAFQRGIGPGRVVRASGRAHTGFLDKMRADLFDQMFKYGGKMGLLDDPKYLRDAAEFINAATGRGGLGKLERSAEVLNATIFSPRLMASRFKLLNPVYYAKLSPGVRQEAIKSALAFGGMALTVSALGKAAGADVELDPRNANFMKLRFGNTRYDPLGGFQQPIRMLAQFVSGKIISSTTGKEITLGEGYRPLTRFEVAQRFFEMKESPIASFITAMMRGRNAIGEKTDVPTEVMNRLIPMVAQDMQDIYREKGELGILMATPAIFGVGVQTYGGLQIWGLDNKDYPALNKELNRLKTTAGFPSTSAFGNELTNSEYKKLKDATGKKIATELYKLIGSMRYTSREKEIDKTKNKVKKTLFRDKWLESKRKKK
jgi:hypothetical protein